jgi:hypothetical protein
MQTPCSRPFPGVEDGKGARARLLSCACRPASAWLDTLPLSRALELKSGEFHASLRHRLGLTALPPNAPDVQCGCEPALRRLPSLTDGTCASCSPSRLLEGTLSRPYTKPSPSPGADSICGSVAKRLRLCFLLCGLVRTYWTTGGEAPAAAQRRGRRPRRRHMGLLRRRHHE